MVKSCNFVNFFYQKVIFKIDQEIDFDAFCEFKDDDFVKYGFKDGPRLKITKHLANKKEQASKVEDQLKFVFSFIFYFLIFLYLKICE